MQIFSYLYLLTNWIFSGYCITILPILIACATRPSGRNKALLAASLTVLLAASCIFLPVMVFGYWAAAVMTKGMQVHGPYWYLYGLMMLLRLSPQLCWIKKYRHSPKAALLLFVLCGAGFVTEPLMTYLTSRHQDQLPSRWTYYDTNWGLLLLSVIAYCGLLFLVLLLRRKMKRSAFSG